MLFEEKHMGLLQNLEYSIIIVYRNIPLINDYNVISALEAIIDFYKCQLRNSTPRIFNLSEKEKIVYDSIYDMCELRIGRKQERFVSKDDSSKISELPPASVTDLIDCLKKIYNSAQKWNKSNGRQGYLNFIKQFLN